MTAPRRERKRKIKMLVREQRGGRTLTFSRGETEALWKCDLFCKVSSPDRSTVSKEEGGKY